MKCDVVVGLQYGSEAKGKLCQKLAVDRKYDYSVRVQSIQAGHTVFYKGTRYKMRTIPCAWVEPNTMLLLGPGCFIHKELLLKEIGMLESIGIPIRERLIVDYRAFYVVDEDFAVEKSSDLTGKIGSTSEGAGASLIRKLWRTSCTRVKDDDWQAEHGIILGDTVTIMQNANVLLEGCQGTMLAVHTSRYYPYVTSRECTVSGICSEAGVSPGDVNEVWGVFRTFPIRVGENSGETGGREMTWDEISDFAGEPITPERTTVTDRVRRIFEPSPADLAYAVMLNKPDYLVMTFLDYVNFEDENKTRWSDLSEKSKEWIQDLELSIGRLINLIGTGKDPKAWIKQGSAGGLL